MLGGWLLVNFTGLQLVPVCKKFVKSLSIPAFVAITNAIQIHAI
jgi:hypothetical protein